MGTLIGDLEAVRVDGDPNEYRVGYLDSVDAVRPHRVALTTMPQDNTRNAAAICTDLIRTFTGVRCVVMIGIAGGIPSPAHPERHVRLGDVVVAADGIVDYGHVRQVSGTADLRRSVDGISMELVRAARELELRAYQNDRTMWSRWLTPARGRPTAVFARPPTSEDRLYIRGRLAAHPERTESGHLQSWPKVHYGAIGCADVLLRDEHRRDELAARHGILAVEMEGSGIAASAVLHGVHWFMVRGIADYCENRGKNDKWHAYASMSAAACLRMMLATCRPFPVWRAAPRSGVIALLPDQERDGLFSLLDQAPETDLRDLWRTAVSELTPLPGSESATVYELFDHLVAVNAGPDGVPPAIVFVEELANRVDQALGRELRRWTNQVAARLNISELVQSHREMMRAGNARSGQAAVTTTRPVPPRLGRPCLVIQIVPDGIDPDLCMISHWIQHRAGPWNPEPGGEPIQTPCSKAESVVEVAIRHAEEAWRDNTDPIAIEFLLPTELLHIAVEWWCTDLDSATPSPLCLDYAVVVRSLDRMHARFRHRHWIGRWNALWREPAGHRLYWGQGGEAGADIGHWNARLRDDPTITSVVLSAPPHAQTGRTQLEIALSAGAPVILWDRRVPRPDQTSTLIEDLARGHPEELIVKIRNLRADAAKSSSLDQQAHPGLHLALLWDDPDRPVDGRGSP